MSYECCGSGEAAGETFAASLSDIQRLLRYAYDYTSDWTSQLQFYTLNVTVIILIILIVVPLLVYGYLRVVSCRIETSLSTIRNWFVGLLRGRDKSIGIKRADVRRKHRPVAPPNMRVNGREYYRDNASSATHVTNFFTGEAGVCLRRVKRSSDAKWSFFFSYGYLGECV